MFCSWSDEYNIGNTIIDFQHKQLFEIINALYLGRHDAQIQKKCFAELKRYAIRHFSTEEDAMCAYGYPEQKIDEHIKQHAQFAGRINEFATAAENGNLMVMDAVMKYLKHWLAHHVLECDRDLKPYLRCS